MVQYVYDAWGNHKISGSNTTLGNLNPFRYRSYFYDTESKLYYLKTRYYDPEVGRFINMDGIQYADPETINGLNLYAYCGNNPVNYVDPDGTNWFSGIINFIKNLSDGLSKLGNKLINLFNFSNKGVGDDFSFDISGETWLGNNTNSGATGAVLFLGFAAGALGLTGGSGALVFAGAGSAVIGSGALTSGVLGGLLGLINILFSKGFGSRPGHNSHENKQFSDAMKKLGINSKSSPQWQKGQRALENLKKSGEYIDKYEDLLSFLLYVLGL